MRQLIEYKLQKIESENYWTANNGRSSNSAIQKIDDHPTILNLGDGVKYALQLQYMKEQPGSGRLERWPSEKDLTQTVLFGDSWKTIFNSFCELMNSIQKKLKRPIDQRKLILKKDRKTYAILSKKGKDLINITRLLFCYEVSRRLLAHDRYQKLPILLFLPHVMDNMCDNRDYIVGTQVSDNFQSLFFGPQRDTIIAHRLAEKIRIQDLQKMRASLNLFCDESEDSEFYYMTWSEYLNDPIFQIEKILIHFPMVPMRIYMRDLAKYV